MLNPDFRDMLCAFNAERVEYLVVGAYAMAAYGFPRATGDLDFWIRRTPENANRVLRALAAFGAPADQVTRDELLTRDLVIQLGVEPSRIDILTSIDGVEFEEAYPRRTSVRLDDVDVPLLGREDLIRNKRATGRPKDAVDAAALERSPERS
ncbi:MAG: hypothetical protein IRY91_07910 [Gemmatimonadaceae bacterium]|nr:hypothetical protein [Gemmatimonadaceae bacterium]